MLARAGMSAVSLLRGGAVTGGPRGPVSAPSLAIAGNGACNIVDAASGSARWPGGGGRAMCASRRGASTYLERPTSYPLHKIKVVLLENIHARGVELFEREGFQVELHKGALEGQELIDVAGDCHILGIRSKTLLTKEFFDTIGWHSRRLWAVGCFCIGTNQVDLDAAASAGVPVFNAPFSNTRSVAEKTIAETIALARQLFQRSMDLHSGKWAKSANGAHEVRGRTLGIVGYGRIGTQVSILAEQLGMRVIFYDPIKKLSLGNAIEASSLEEVLEEADTVTLHVPQTPDTHMMIGPQELAAMKPGAHLINNARGSVVDLDALADALHSGHIGGATIDVFPVEPAQNGDGFATPLQGCNNTILTPHIGGSTEEAQKNIADEVAAKLVRVMNNGSTTSSVNCPEVELPILHHKHRRLLHFHKNVPGVLSKMHGLIAELGVNVSAQFLQTDVRHGYVILDVEPFAAPQLVKGLRNMAETVWLREIL